MDLSISNASSPGRDSPLASPSPPLPAPEGASFSQSSSLSPNSSTTFAVRQNQVSTAVLAGVPIVCLYIDGKERLCLAQISNTLLKDFSYNEIHNRRVALGITCVQCTPVQLEILRRAGAMPISSRRCGMITKREAERLVKSFLEEIAPPKLPENFAFQIEHKCGWGCKGSFIPSRYNSSRAKCIRCTFCNMFFSPNKFIFHFHRIPESKYHHPDAANFNSWRRHIKLDYENANDDMTHAWEDVKAMFNGGSRKRLMTPTSKTSRQESDNKRGRYELETGEITKIGTMPYNYPMVPLPSTATSRNMTAFPPRSTHPAFPFMAPESPTFSGSNQKSSLADIWRNKNSPYCNPFNLFWAKNIGVYPEMAQNFRGFDLSLPRSECQDGGKNKESKTMNLNNMYSQLSGENAASEHSIQVQNFQKYLSAFKPVARDTPNTKSNKSNDKLWRIESMTNFGQEEDSEEDMYCGEGDLDDPQDEDIDVNVTDVECGDDNVTSTLLENSLHSGSDPEDSDKIALKKKKIEEKKSESSNTDDIKVNNEESIKENNEPKLLETDEKLNDSSINEDQNQESRKPEKVDSDNEDLVLSLSKEDLLKELVRMMEEKKNAEKEYQKLKEKLANKKSQDETSEKTSKEDTLDAEIKVQGKNDDEDTEIVQQKLREAHNALSEFSSKMTDLKTCVTKKTP